jgi:hypothetical protein
MEIITICFQTPQDFSGFRKLAHPDVISYDISNLEVVCKCDRNKIEKAITQFGGMVIEDKKS